MPYVVIYASTQACAPVLELALRLRAQGHRLRSLVYLPAPQPVRQASLRLEQAALQQIERTIVWVLSQYAEGRRLPDPTRERDLRADLDVTRWQLQQVATSLHALPLTPSHG
jgi:thioesterase domain-containing protein